MKKLNLVLLLLFSSILTVTAQSKWGFDKSHSEIGFIATHMVIAEVTGEFGEFDIMVTAKNEDFTDSEISFTAKVNSLNTGEEQRDNHLKSPDFFDAGNHPDITFKSKSLKKEKDGKYKLTGDLTIRGTTKEVTLDVMYRGTIQGPWGKTRAGFKITGMIDRFDYGLAWNKALETGGLIVSKEIEIVCNVELIKQ